MRGSARRALLLLVVPAAGLLAACASVPLPERDGADLYRRKCGSCHRLYAPAEIPAKNWESRLALMSKRARLTPGETEAIRLYVEPDLVPAHAAPGPAPLSPGSS